VAVTIQELIAQRENLANRKKKKYTIETSVGEIVVQVPDAALIAESLNLSTGFEINKHLVYNSVILPNLRDGELQKAFGAFEPTDIVAKIFLPGEISRIGDELFKLAGYDTKIVSKLYEEVKNS